MINYTKYHANKGNANIWTFKNESTHKKKNKWASCIKFMEFTLPNTIFQYKYNHLTGGFTPKLKTIQATPPLHFQLTTPGSARLAGNVQCAVRAPDPRLSTRSLRSSTTCHANARSPLAPPEMREARALVERSRRKLIAAGFVDEGELVPFDPDA